MTPARNDSSLHSDGRLGFCPHPPVELSADRLVMNALIARAPTRLDFGGGWTDVPPYSEEEGGFVCNIAIARYATVRVCAAENNEASIDTRRATDTALAEAAVRRAGIEGITVAVTSDFPLGAGLGGSSAAGVAVNGALAAWRGVPLDRAALAEQSRAIEVEDLRSPVGDRTTTRPRTAGRWRSRSATTRACGDCRSRQQSSHRSSDDALSCTPDSRVSRATRSPPWSAHIVRAIAHVLHALGRMKALASAMADEICAKVISTTSARSSGSTGNISAHCIRRFPRRSSTAILERARAAGARGGKALGASGGGCVLVIAGEDNVDARDRCGNGARAQHRPRRDRRARPHLQTGFEMEITRRWRS